MRVGQLLLPSGFGEIANAWVKLASIRCLPGYEDAVWDVVLNGDDPRGCEYLVHCLPGVRHITAGTHGTRHVLEHALPPDASVEELFDGPVCIVTDHFLARGNLLAEYLPELPADYHYPLRIPADASERVRQLVGTGPYVVVHPSGVYRRLFRNGYGDVWQAPQWADLCDRLTRGLSCPLYVIGAPRDEPMLQELVSRNAVPEAHVLRFPELYEVLALLRGAAYVVAFPSGPAVVTGVLGVPHCTLFRAEVQRALRGTFTDPAMLADGRAYLPFFTDSPDTVAAEVLGRVNHLVRSGYVPPPPVCPGFQGPVRPSPAVTWPEYVPAFDADQVFGILNGKPLPTPALGTLEAYAPYYALARAVRPKALLQLGSDVYSAAAAVAGTLDAGVPIAQVGLEDAAHRSLAVALLRAHCARCSFGVRIAVDNRRDLAHLPYCVGYDLAHVLPGPDLRGDLTFAWRHLNGPGWLVVRGNDDPAVRVTLQSLASEWRRVPVSCPSCPDWALIEK